MEKLMTNASAVREPVRPTLHHVGLTTANLPDAMNAALTAGRSVDEHHRRGYAGPT